MNTSSGLKASIPDIFGLLLLLSMKQYVITHCLLFIHVKNVFFIAKGLLYPNLQGSPLQMHQLEEILQIENLACYTDHY